jgi:hypothetical protein
MTFFGDIAGFKIGYVDGASFFHTCTITLKERIGEFRFPKLRYL